LQLLWGPQRATEQQQMSQPFFFILNLNLARKTRVAGI